LYVVVVLLAVTGVLWAWGVDRVDAVGKVIGVVAALLGLPPLVVTAFRLRWGAPGPGSLSLGEAADMLAEAARRQWEAEARARRLDDPYPLPVAWEAADPGSAEEWALLRAAAAQAPGGPSNDPGRWADGPEGLSGSGSDIEEVFLQRVPTRRLVVLGEPGAGKTMLLIRLLLALLSPAHREPGGPLPFLFSLASFDPTRHDLRAWMTHQLIQEYPMLGSPAAGFGAGSGLRDGSLARALIDNGFVIPFFDGLDELPRAVRPHALQSVNEAFPAQHPLVLSSRTSEYGQALAPARNATGVRLNGVAGIVLRRLDAAVATAYLSRDAGEGTGWSAGRWSRTAHVLQGDPGSPLAQALSTPLGLFLARTIYNPRPGESTAGVPHPDDLLDIDRSSRAAVEHHLFRAFVPAAYRPRLSRPCPWSLRQAERYLAFLARHLEDTLAGSPHIAWWQVSASYPTRRLILALGFGGLLTSLLAGLLLGWPVLGGGVLVVALLCASATTGALFTPVHEHSGPTIRVGWLPNIFVGVGAGSGLVAGLVLGLPFGLWNAVTTAVGAALVGGLAGGLRAGVPTMSAALSPQDLLAVDRRVFVGLWITGALAAGSVVGLGTRWQLGVLCGLAFGTFLATGGAVWWRYATARTLLAAQRRLPWRLMRFLADAHVHRGVLRRVGTVYQFRHLTLQRHLARRDVS
jgi:hypothetical protein